MKKQLLPLIFLCLTTITFGQIVITNNDLAGAGTSVILAYDTLPDPGIVPGDSGPNKVWDFTNVTAHILDTFHLVMPSATPYADEYPEANFASISAEDDTVAVFSYMIRNNDMLSSTGTAIQGGEEALMFLHTEPSEILLDFPVTYGDSYNENYLTNIILESPEPGADSIRMKTDIDKETHVDAWGTLSIPIGTYSVLRQRVDELRVDSIFIKLFDSWMFVAASQDSATYYSWWTNNSEIGFDLFSMDTDYGTGEVRGASFINSFPTGIEQPNQLTFNAYPNPFSHVLNIDFEKNQTGELIILNQYSQAVHRQQISKQKAIQLDLSALPSGVYLCTLRTHTGETICLTKAIKQ